MAALMDSRARCSVVFGTAPAMIHQVGLSLQAVPGIEVRTLTLYGVEPGSIHAALDKARAVGEGDQLFLIKPDFPWIPLHVRKVAEYFKQSSVTRPTSDRVLFLGGPDKAWAWAKSMLDDLSINPERPVLYLHPLSRMDVVDLFPKVQLASLRRTTGFWAGPLNARLGNSSDRSSMAMKQTGHDLPEEQFAVLRDVCDLLPARRGDVHSILGEIHETHRQNIGNVTRWAELLGLLTRHPTKGWTVDPLLAKQLRRR